MKVYYKMIIRDSDTYSTIYELLDVEFCCNEMEKAWKEKAIIFGEYDSWGINNNKNINITHCNPYPEGACWDEFPIKLCPFCGTKIVTVEKMKVKEIKEYVKRTIIKHKYKEIETNE